MENIQAPFLRLFLWNFILKRKNINRKKGAQGYNEKVSAFILWPVMVDAVQAYEEKENAGDIGTHKNKIYNGADMGKRICRAAKYLITAESGDYILMGERTACENIADAFGSVPRRDPV